MQSDINVVPVKSEISLRETTIDGCAQRRRKRRMELQREKPLRFLQTTVRNRPLPLGDRGRRGKSAGDGGVAGGLSNPGELGCGAAEPLAGSSSYRDTAQESSPSQTLTFAPIQVDYGMWAFSDF